MTAYTQKSKVEKATEGYSLHAFQEYVKQVKGQAYLIVSDQEAQSFMEYNQNGLLVKETWYLDNTPDCVFSNQYSYH